MNEKKTIRKYSILSLMTIFITPFWLEGLIGFNRKMNEEYGYSGKLNYRLYDGGFDIYTELYNYFDRLVFPICLILAIAIVGIIKIRFYSKYLSNNWLRPLFEADLIYRLFIISISAFTIFQFNLTEFWDDNIIIYRLMYLLTLVLPIILIYEFVMNKGKTVFPQLSYRKKQESFNSEEEKLTSLKKMNIINDDTYSSEVVKIKREKILMEVRNSPEYIEFMSNIDFAINKGLLNEEEKKKKLLEKENEMLSNYKNNA